MFMNRYIGWSLINERARRLLGAGVEVLGTQLLCTIRDVAPPSSRAHAVVDLVAGAVEELEGASLTWRASAWCAGRIFSRWMCSVWVRPSSGSTSGG